MQYRQIKKVKLISKPQKNIFLRLFRVKEGFVITNEKGDFRNAS